MHRGIIPFTFSHNNKQQIQLKQSRNKKKKKYAPKEILDIHSLSESYYSNGIAFDAHNCSVIIESNTWNNYTTIAEHTRILPTFCDYFYSDRDRVGVGVGVGDGDGSRIRRKTHNKNNNMNVIKAELQSMKQMIVAFNESSTTKIYAQCESFLKSLTLQSNEIARQLRIRNVKNNNAKTTQAMHSNCYKTVFNQCLNLKYEYQQYEREINHLATQTTQGTFASLQHRIRHRNELQQMLFDVMTIADEYGVLFHFFGTTLLSWYRNCNPIAYHDHDLDLAIFQHHFDPLKLANMFNDPRLRIKYGFSIDLDIERVPPLVLLKEDTTADSTSSMVARKLRFQFHVSSMKVYELFEISSIDIFIINPTKFAYFTQNIWYEANFFWHFTPYQLKQIEIEMRIQSTEEDEDEEEVDTDEQQQQQKKKKNRNDGISDDGNLKTLKYTVWIPCETELLLSEIFGNDWMYLPWQMMENNIDTDTSHLDGNYNRVEGMRAPIKILDAHTDDLTLDTAQIIEFCNRSDYYYSQNYESFDFYYDVDSEPLDIV